MSEQASSPSNDAKSSCFAVRAWPDRDLTEARLALEARELRVPLLGCSLADTARPIVELCAFFADAAQRLFPSWLPEAEGIQRPGGLGADAVSLLAQRAARQGVAMGPVIEPIALAALSGSPADLSHLADETVVRQCVRLIEASYGVERPTLLLEIPDGGSELGNMAALDHAVAWLTGLGVCTIKLCGPGSATIKGVWVDRDDTSRLTHRKNPTSGAMRDSSVSGHSIAAKRYLTPLTGRPSPNSDVEKRVEQYLARCSWASGRRWQVPWQADVLSAPIRTDLMFAAEFLIVEFDGPEHGSQAIYGADRRRDRILMAHGFKVVRFTNDEVDLDLERVATEIRQFVEEKRGSRT